jgi:hypothetical protein
MENKKIMEQFPAPLPSENQWEPIIELDEEDVMFYNNFYETLNGWGNMYDNE